MASYEHLSNVSSKYFLMAATGHLGFVLFCSANLYQMSLVCRLLLVVVRRYTRWQNIEHLIHNNLFQRNSELRCAYERKPFDDFDSVQVYLKVQFVPHSELCQGYNNQSVIVV